MKRKLLIISINFIIGLIWGLYFNKNIALILCALLFVYFVLNKNRFGILCIATIVISCVYVNNVMSDYNSFCGCSENCIINGTVINVLKSDENSKQYVLKIESINNNKRYKNKRILVEEKRAKEYSDDTLFGSYISIEGKIEEADSSRNPKGFNYNEYLRSQKIYGIVYVKSGNVKVLKENNVGAYVSILNMLKNRIIENIHCFLPNESADICCAIVMGDKVNLDENVKNVFSDASLSHVLAVSGMHVGYIAGCIYFVCSAVGKRKQKYVTIILLILFCNLIGNQNSAIRAVCMMSIQLFGGIMHKKADSLTSLSVCSMGILVYNPYAIKDVGFCLSFGATLGIVLCSNVLENKLKNILNQNKIAKYIKSNLIVSISANILLLPIIAFFFNKISFTFIISSIIASLLLAVIMPLAIICTIFSFFSIYLSKYIGSALNIFIVFLYYLSQFCSCVKLGNFFVGRPSLWFCTNYYALVGFSFYANNIKCKFKKIIMLYLVINLTVITVSTTISIASNKLRIYFVDVGQGDCTVIKTPNGKNIMIDGGGNDTNEYVGKNIVVPYLLNRGIKQIDIIIISHFDSDHVGGILTVLETIKVKEIIISKQFAKSQNYEKFKEIVSKKKVKVHMVNKGDEIQIEKNINISILWPNNKNVIAENTLNNNSIVCKLNYGIFSMIFTGDIEEIAENEILNEYKNNSKLLNSTVLKVGHHGSKTSSTQWFINAINPKISIIGVGKNNNFGHPSDIVIERLKACKSKIYRTDQMGEISLVVDTNGKVDVKQFIK